MQNLNSALVGPFHYSGNLIIKNLLFVSDKMARSQCCSTYWHCQGKFRARIWIGRQLFAENFKSKPSKKSKSLSLKNFRRKASKLCHHWRPVKNLPKTFFRELVDKVWNFRPKFCKNWSNGQTAEQRFLSKKPDRIFWVQM